MLSSNSRRVREYHADVRAALSEDSYWWMECGRELPSDSGESDHGPTESKGEFDEDRAFLDTRWK